MTIRDWYRQRVDAWQRRFYASFLPGLVMLCVPRRYGRNVWVFLALYASIALFLGTMAMMMLKIARIPCPVCHKTLGIPHALSVGRFDGPCPHCGASFDQQLP